MIKYLKYIGIILIVYSCEKENITPELKLKNCRIEYLNFMDDRRFLENSYTIFDDTMYFEYSNNKIVKTIGGFQILPPGSNMPARVFISNVTDSIVFAGNSILVYTKPKNPYFLRDNPDNPTVYSLNGADKLEKFTRRDGVTFKYIYKDSLIIEKNENDVVIRTFIMANNNLKKVLTEHYGTFGNMYFKKEIIFQDYDNNPNPFKNKYYILGAFYRAFSENNFSKYTVNDYIYLDDGSIYKHDYFMFSMPIIYRNNLPLFGDYE